METWDILHVIQRGKAGKAKRERLTHFFRSSIRRVTSLFTLYTEDPVRLPRIISTVANTVAFKRCPPETEPEEVPRIACKWITGSPPSWEGKKFPSRESNSKGPGCSASTRLS